MKNKKVFRGTYIALVMAVVFFVGASAKPAQASAAAFYKGKVVNFMVGFSAGGGYDTYSRLLASALEKHTQCTVVVRNMPGAGGFVALNHMYTSAKRDGRALLIAPLGSRLAQVLKSAGVKYDCRGFKWLIRLTWEPQVMSVAAKSPYKSADDLRKAKRLIAAETVVSGTSHVATVVAAEALGLDQLKSVFGYPGSTECILAVIRGECDVYFPSVGTFLRHSEELRPLAVVARKRVEELPDAPAISEFALKKGGERALEIFLNLWQVGRSVLTTPDVPPERVKFLREVLWKSLQDQEFRKKAKRLKRSLKPLPGAEVEVLIKKVMNLAPDDVAMLKHIVFEKYSR